MRTLLKHLRQQPPERPGTQQDEFRKGADGRIKADTKIGP
jgi:hypothetical protein